ncbi:MAG: asparagine synthase (glutamine-hydrolyzing) [Rhodothermales bacterium]
MCGFTGYFTAGRSIEEFATHRLLKSMAQTIVHRGPDSAGYWADTSAGVGLAHRRLAIVDLSPAGAQPMSSVSERYVLAFNGEIYNHMRLRGQLNREGRLTANWRGHSDTETLLAGIDAWGLEATLKRAIGMFALAVWDRSERMLTLARDRLGEKPLYYGWQGQGGEAVFLFGSELSALRRHPAFSAEINRNALALYMRHNYIGGQYSIFSGIHKLLPGHLLTLSCDAPEPVLRSWWSGAATAENGVGKPFPGSPKDAVDTLEGLLRDAIAQQMIADVPLGAFLSGGVDSSTVVALMQTQSSQPISTYSIGFHEKSYNEAQHAKAVAKHLGTNHTEYYVTSEQAQTVIPRLPTLYSEPFADSSQIPTYLVSQLARQHVAVSLSGDAGDELFCGYRRYQMTAALWGKISYLPLTIRQLTAGLITAIPPTAWDKLGAVLSVSRLGDKLHKGGALLDKRTVTDLYLGMVSHWEDPAAVVLGSTEPATILTGAAPALEGLGDVERMMALDMLSYLPDDILVKVDRAAMGVSLETRIPFLDHRVVEFAWSLPLNYKLRNGVSKWPLRQVLYRHIPRDLIERPKMGFGVPIDAWLRGPLKDWAEDLLDQTRLRQEGFFNPILIRARWAEHLSGQRNWQHHLWNVLMFQAWLEVHND